jgi:hypothetical protein
MANWVASADLKTITFHWVVGVSRRERFPAEDILVCNGIPCFIPDEMRPVLNGRSIVLADSRLEIIPAPPPP